jgi:hypothetical protein
VVVGFAGEDAGAGVVLRQPDVAVGGFEVEAELPRVGGLKVLCLEFEGDKATEPPVEEEQVDEEVTRADLKPTVLADDAQLSAEFEAELLQVGDQRAPQVGLVEAFGEIGELQQVVGTARNPGGGGVDLSHRWPDNLLGRSECALEEGARDLAFELALCPALPGCRAGVELPLPGGPASALDEEALGPVQL